MMCKTDQTCFITITSFSGEKEIPTSKKFTLRASARGQDLYDYIEKLLNSPADTFELFLQAPGRIIDLSMRKDSTMSELGVDFSCDLDSNEVNHRNYTLLVKYNTNKRLPPQCGENAYELTAVSNNASEVGNELVTELALETVSKPTLKPGSESTLNSLSESTLRPVSEPTLKPVTEPTLKPVPDPTLKPVSEPTLKPVSVPTLKPVSEPASEPTSEPGLEPASEPALEPASEPASEPAYEPASEPASEPVSEPASEPASGPASEPASESVSEPTSEPASDMYLNLYQDFCQSLNQNQPHETTSEPISEPTPESATKPVSQPATQPVCANFKSFIKPETSYVGLVNQAMTCYLNSLLQSLYMTPEFRNALYNWEYVDGSEKDAANSIPYQLQKLFLNLQTSTKSAVETTSLTKSFGWDSTEAWQQHDIQELCRVMFDTLEQKLKNTEQADLINRLYEGKMIDYVKCLECGTQKSREDTFLDIPLPVRPFGSNVAYNSVEEAIRAFVQYETLEGANQYHCEKCNKKCDAHKGLKFTKFPYLLTLHLKRFDFDYKTFHRIKLNDKVTFPDILNLNSFISSTNQESPGGEEDIGLGIKCDDSSTTDSGTLDDDCPPCENNLSNTNHQTNHDQDDDEGIDMNNGPSTSNCNVHNHENEKNRGNCAGAKGPYFYELFSIMIHSGNASGGHYYAYIKDFRTQNWLWFNDQNVSQITHDDIQKTYGGGTTRAYYSGAYSSSTNAYMLMYRQIDPARNALPMQVEDFPKHIQELVKKMQEGEENDRRILDKEKSARVKVYCGHPTKDKSKIYEYTSLRLTPDDVWSDLKKEAYTKFQLEGVVNLDQCRLVTYDAKNDVIKGSFEGREHETVSSIWFVIRSRYSLMLEIRRKDEEFESYQPGSIASKVYVIDVPKEEVINGPIIVRAMLSQTVREYKQIVGKAINMDPKQMKIVLRKHTKDLTLIDCDDNDLQYAGFSEATKVYVSSMLDTEKVPFHWSKLFAIIENLGNVILLHVALPDTSKEILEELNIPSLEDKCKEIEKPISNGPSKLSAEDSKRNVKAKLQLLLDSYNREISDLSKLSKTNEEPTVRNISPELVVESEDLGPSEQSNSEDSSLSDSDKTLVGDAPKLHFFSSPNLPSSFEKRQIDGYLPTAETEDWDIDDNSEYYFKATPCTNTVEKQLSVLVDKRTKMSVFKKNLEPYVGVSAEYFKIFRNFSDYGDAACIHIKKQLTALENGERITLKLGRALRSGETKVKVYQLNLNSIELYKFLCEWIFSMDMTVGQVKRELLVEIKKKYDIDIPYERCRLREKFLKIPCKVFLDDQKFEDVRFSSHFEMIIQELADKEPVTDNNQVVVLVKKWSPAEMQLGPFQEVVLDGNSVEGLTKKLSSISDIPEEYIDVARGKGSFPYDMPLLRIESDLDWNELNEIPFIIDDGFVFFYKDRREKPKLLTPHEVKEITTKEAPLQILSMSGRYCSSRRQEKALKIYLDTK